MKKIAIIGTGNIGGNLGKKWADSGHEIIFGVRDLQSKKALDVQHVKTRITNIPEAIAEGEIVVLAVPASALEEVVKSSRDWQDKLIVDTTNPISFAVSSGFKSLAEAVANWANSTRVVKAFNTTGSANLVNPVYDGINIDTFICGDNEDDKAIVGQLAEQIGFEVVDAGGLANADLLENLAKLCVTLAYRQQMGADISFKLLKR